MKELRYTRRGKVIITLERKDKDGEVIQTTETKDHRTINKAKKASRRLQLMLDKALGRGTVRSLPYKTHYYPPVVSNDRISLIRRGR